MPPDLSEFPHPDSAAPAPQAGRWVIVGVTAWGLTLAFHLARAGAPVSVFCRDDIEAAAVALARTHPVRAPLVRLPASVQVTADSSSLAAAGAVVLAVPAQAMRPTVRRIAATLNEAALVVSAAKGIEIATGRRMSEVIVEETGRRSGAIVALSGPNLAGEVIRGLPATAVAASADGCAAATVQRAFSTATFRVYTHHDLIGVELGGALKNIIALAAGISDGLGFGDNAKSALITRGLAEIARLGVAMGAEAATFSGLSGLGDLIATCASPLSRNRQVGEALGRGRPLDDILATLGHVAEGVPTTRAAALLAQRYGVSMPITDMMARVLFEGWPPEEAARRLMERDPRPEFAP